MNTYTVSLKVNYPKNLPFGSRPNSCDADIYLDGVKIGQCRVWSEFNHCFENDYFNSARKIYEQKLVELTGLTPSQAGTYGIYKLEYNFI